MKHTIFGIGFDCELPEIEKDFYYDSSYDDNNALLLSKKTYSHEEEGLNFKYKYAIKVDDMREYTGEDERIITLHLVVTPESTCLKKLKDIAETGGIGTDDVTYSDIVGYGCTGILAHEKVKGKNLDKKMPVKLAEAVHVVEAIDGLLGFYLDRPINMVGTTSWDIIREVVVGTDAISASLDRVFE